MWFSIDTQSDYNFYLISSAKHVLHHIVNGLFWVFFPFFQHQEVEIEELFRTQDDLQAKYNDELREKKVKFHLVTVRLCQCHLLDCVTLCLNLHCRVGMLITLKWIQFLGHAIVTGYYVVP